MFRRPLFWLVFAVASIGAAIFTARNFSRAFPLVSIDFKMDRAEALSLARELAGARKWPPTGFDQAVAFQASPEVQSFIELEGGGKQELARILDERLVSLHTWEVRHYREGETRETRIRFTPDGQPYGFQVRLPEQEAGASLGREEARAIGERAATEEWKVDFTRYALVEASQKTHPGGRQDQTFVYERQDIRLGEGKYRLRLVVGGDRLTELTYFVQVPEAFSRRYQQMRSTNDAITAFSSAALFVVYLLGCCGVGLFFLMRERWVIWRAPFLWSLCICLLVGSDLFNSWPRLWMEYDTAVSASGFAIQRVVIGLLGVGLMIILLTISLMAAESLSRRAFPHHVQLWRSWSVPAASSKSIVGQTAAGYLLVSLFFAYEVVLYAFGHSRLGWWSPSDSLINPDLFGTYVPALSAVASSLQAGFWEECLFRAVPLACAALIGSRFGYRRTLIAIAMVVQALIFGAGHAGYANQPAYARVVELIIPSFAFGAMYLAFGLVPGIILHYAFDLVWFAMPIFMSSGPRARFEQVLVILLAFAPLGVSLVARLRTGRWVPLPGELLNRAWAPRAIETPEPVADVIPETSVLSPVVVRVLPVAGALALIAWLGLVSFKSDAPPLTLSRNDAEQSARQALIDRGIRLDSSWKVFSRAEAQPGEAHRFVWRNAGREKYNQLLGSYLSVPHWFVRFARFEGDVAARAEEYQVIVADHPQLLRIRHQLAEAAPGKSLSEAEARVVAQSVAMTALQTPADSLKEISAEAQKRPMRGDWTFQFADTREHGLGDGQARIAVVIAGDEVVDASPYVYVPEAWARAERARRNLPDILTVLCIIAVAPFALAGIAGAVVRWSRGRGFSVRAFCIFFGGVALLYASSLVNNWLVTISAFPTAQPFLLLSIVTGVVGLVFVLIISTGLGLIGGSVMDGVEWKSSVSFRKSILLGLSLGVIIVALMAAAKKLGTGSTDPQWIGFGSVAALFPFIAAALAPVNSFLTLTLVLATMLQQIRWLSRRWGRQWRFSIALFLVIGLIGTGLDGVDTVSSWLLDGVLTGIVLAAAYLLVLRYAFAIIPVAFGTITMLETLTEGAARSYPMAFAGSIMGAALVLLVSLTWARVSTGNEIRTSSV